MKLQQIRFVVEVVRQGYKVSAAADALYTSQPGVSKQIKLLEEELGVPLFKRSGKNLTGLTPAGEEILQSMERMLGQVQEVKTIAAEFNRADEGEFSIATTHTQARYVLPDLILWFRKRYPKVQLHIQQGTPMQIAEMTAAGQVDCAIATEAIECFDDLVMLPCYRWNRAIITPCDHPLRDVERLTLEEISQYPIITYVFGFTGRSRLDKAFNQRQLQPNVVITAADTDVIKTYVRIGLGIGIVAKMAYDPKIDQDLCALDASHLFEASTTRIGLRKGTYLRKFHYDFFQKFAPHLSPEVVDEVTQGKSDYDFSDIELPVF